MSEGPTTRPKDSDLRQAVHAHGARPGTELWKLLVELQELRDARDGQKDGSAGGPPRGARGRLTSPL